MNKEIQVLHTIFELELNPPFTLMAPPNDPNFLSICNRFLNNIGYIRIEFECINLYPRFEIPLLRRIKRVFNVNELSDDDVYLIAKHLFDWLQVKSPARVTSLKISNIENYEPIIYKKK